MLETFTHETFADHVGARVRLTPADGGDPVEATLVASDPAGGEAARMAAESGRRTPFSLIFRLAPGTRQAQGTYTVEQEGRDPVDIFLVPIQPDADGPRYEAVFT